MRKILIWALVLASLGAQAQTLKFGEGESYKPAVKITGLPDSITRVEISLVKEGSNTPLRKFSTVGGTIVRVNDSLYTFSFTDQITVGKSGKGTWQVEIQTPSLGVRKSRIFPYEITKSTTNRGTETGVGASGYSQIFHWNFTPTVPTFTTIETGYVLVNGQSIAATISDSLDPIRALIAEVGGGGTPIDTTEYLKKTTAAGLYVAKVAGKGLSTVDFTSAYETKLNGIASGATANSTDAQLRDRTTHTGVQGISTVTGLQDSLTAKVNTTDVRLSNARTPTTHIHSQSDVTGLAATLGAKSDSSHSHPISKVTGLQTALDLKAGLTSPTFTTSILTPIVIGGTGTTSTLTFRPTSGVGTTNADIIFQVGNNGGTEAMRIFNGGNISIGGATNTGELFQVKGASRLGGNVAISGFLYPLTPQNLGLSVFPWEEVNANSVYVNTALVGTRTAVSSAMAIFSSTTKGVLLPRQTTAQINAVSSPAKGLLIFNTDLNTLCFFDGTVWKQCTATNMNP